MAFAILCYLWQYSIFKLGKKRLRTRDNGMIDAILIDFSLDLYSMEYNRTGNGVYVLDVVRNWLVLLYFRSLIIFSLGFDGRNRRAIS